MMRGFTVMELAIIILMFSAVAAVAWHPKRPDKKYDAEAQAEIPIEKLEWLVVCYTPDGTQKSLYNAKEVTFIGDPVPMVHLIRTSGTEVLTNLLCTAEQQ
jgi:hypothetical protein